MIDVLVEVGVRLVFMPVAVDMHEVMLHKKFPVSEYLLGLAVPCYFLILTEYVDGISDFLNDMQVVRCGDDSLSVEVSLEYDIDDVPGRLRIKPRGRLIQDNDLRLNHQC